MRSQVRGGDNDKLCFSVVADREMEREKGGRRTERPGSTVKSDFIKKTTFSSRRIIRSETSRCLFF